VNVHSWRLLFLIAASGLGSLGLGTSPSARGEESSADPAAKPVSFQSDIGPLLSRHCYGCHQGAKQMGGYVMTTFDSLTAAGESQQSPIVPGKPEESHLIELITPIDGQAAMPAAPFPPLSDVEVAMVRRWISEGAVNDSPADSEPQYSAEHPPRYLGPPPIPSIDVSPSGETLAVAGYHEVLLLDALSGARKARLVGISPRINTVRFSPDGKRIAAAGGTSGVRGEVQIWDVASGQLLLSRLISYDALCGISWSPQGDKVAFGASDNVVRAIDAESGEQVLFQGAHEDWVRDTAFTPDGKHLISVARDMSCKLTEVETERFVDNITSITPGALSGGLSSVVAHPQRNEIFIGGADGIPKVYRVFRQTERRIGDDANLVRVFPKLAGRIFSVAISPDGSRLAAAATLDGASEVRVWSYDFNGDLTPELKDIIAKLPASRSAEENQKIQQDRNQPLTELAKITLDSASVYAIAFAADQSLLVAAGDGKVRRIDPAGQLAAEFPVVEVAPGDQIAAVGFDAKAYAQGAEFPTPPATGLATAPPDQVRRLQVQPRSIDLRSPYEYTQLVVTAEMGDGSTHDVTRASRIETPDWVTLTDGGLLRPAANGSGAIVVHYGDHSHAISLSATGVSATGVSGEAREAAEIGAVDYIRDVGPVMSRLGCNAGTCHGAQKGKAGFRLSLRGYDAVFDLRALTDDLAARRINPSDPDASMMLRKPLGITPHQGGTLMTAGDPNHAILRRWIADGCRLDLAAPRVASIEVFPRNPIVASTTAQQQVRVVAHFTDGSQRDVTHQAFIESGNSEVATADRFGLVSAVRRGEAPILARYEGAYAATTLTVMGDRQGYQPTTVETWTPIDQLVAAKWERMKIVPSELCDDATFLRRVHLDLTGLPPSSRQVRAFLADPMQSRMKRGRVIDELIGSQAYVDYWTNKWADLLLVNRKFLEVEGSEKFRHWIRQAIAENRPYDQFAREILTASGSNNENPPASYYKILRTPEDTMENTTHLFMGVRFNCNKCHDHPFERWTQNQYYELTAFFAQVTRQADPASGDRKIGGTAVEGATPLFEKIVDLDSGETMHPNTHKVVPPEFPIEVPFEAADNASRRERLAAWMTDPDNPYFARSYVNRLWGYLFGVGLIEPIDDLRAGNPATNPELLDHLTDTFIASKFDVQSVLREICNSRTYQLSVTSNPWNEDDKLNYSRAMPRRLPAEVIFDSVHAVTGAISNIPGMPAGTRAAAVTDSGVELQDGFLQNLGRPVRESACECERSSELQLGPVMALISGPTIGSAIADPQNQLEFIVQGYPDDDQLATEIFLRALGRMPTEGELAAFHLSKAQITQNHAALAEQLAAAEADWQQRLTQIQQQRQAEIDELDVKIAARQEAIKPDRARMENERQQQIQAAEAALATAQANGVQRQIDHWAELIKSPLEWHPLAPQTAISNNGILLTPLADRSILASGTADTSVYTVTFRTSLRGITGFRLEAMTDDTLPSKGPGLPANGNFVVSEIQVTAAPAATPDAAQPIKIASGNADFTQGSFGPEQVFDGATDGAGGWAVHPATGIEHWATFKLAEPINADGDAILTFTLHQNHGAKTHLLGRFRISVTTTTGEIALGLSERIATAAATPADRRRAESAKWLHDYVLATSAEIKQANEALAVARQPVPPDGELTALQQRKEQLGKPIPDDPTVVQLRADMQQSQQQLQNIRLTAAEDLTWALVNSPAFLFNH
jgi:WD40 repeat protein